MRVKSFFVLLGASLSLLTCMNWLPPHFFWFWGKKILFTEWRRKLRLRREKILLQLFLTANLLENVLLELNLTAQCFALHVSILIELLLCLMRRQKISCLLFRSRFSTRIILLFSLNGCQFISYRLFRHRWQFRQIQYLVIFGRRLGCNCKGAGLLLNLIPQLFILFIEQCLL